MRIYIAGSMTGTSGHGEPMFATTAKLLRDGGHEVRNPVETTPAEHRELALKIGSAKYRQSPEYHENMRRDILYLVNEAEAIYLQPGWTGSPGARCEFMVARAIGLKLLGAAEEVTAHHDLGGPIAVLT